MGEEGEMALGVWGRGRVMCMLRYVCLCSRRRTTSSVVPWVPTIVLWRLFHTGLGLTKLGTQAGLYYFSPKIISVHLTQIFFFNMSSGGGTQALLQSRQALYCLCYSSS